LAPLLPTKCGIFLEIPIFATDKPQIELTAQSQTNDTVVQKIITVETADTIPPTINFTSPQDNQAYINNVILPISYTLSDNQSKAEDIITQVNLDNQPFSQNSLDLSLQETGQHTLTISAHDSAGKTAVQEISFTNRATINSIIANINHYSNLKLIKTQSLRNLLLLSAQTLKIQFSLLEQTQQNNHLPAKTQALMVQNIKLTINRQIDTFINLINHQSATALNPQAANLLLDSLKYVKIK